MLLSALFMPLLAVFYFRSADKTVIEPLQFYKWTTFSYTAWIILPVVLGLVSTMLMYDENQNDMLKQLWIIPISKTGYFFSKFIVVLSYSVCFMLLTAIASVFFGMLPGYITFEWNSISYLFKKCIEIAILTAFSILPLLAVAAAGKNYILPVCVTLVYTFLSFILLMVNMYLHLYPVQQQLSCEIFPVLFWHRKSIFRLHFLYRYMDYCFYRICVHFLKA